MSLSNRILHIPLPVCPFCRVLSNGYPFNGSITRQAGLAEWGSKP
ncbi:hypothetical protein JM93_02006 [Roseibium hamelinense]|uniref:Uncharacterized protein n=1 Tax=Roseibium hamelinense TaxID=150831 RepID=A0A562T1D1_9HYPH|nr:hypothetical protein JM93_02006 [Roseibium hamelinense]